MRKFLLSLLSLSVAGAALALPNAISAPKPIGQGSYSLLGIPLYQATLYTENGAAYAPNAPFILELSYLRNISRDRLVKATISELSRIYGGAPSGLENQLQNCFRDVGKGDRFAAVNTGANSVDLYLNDSKTCTLQGSGVSQQFFAIWLSDASRDPAGSRALRGQ